MKKSTILFIISCLCFSALYCQIESQGYIEFSDSLIETKEYRIDHKYGAQEIKYLGIISDANSHMYKVISSTNIYGKKGVNDIVLVSSDKKLYIYRCNLPHELPTSIKNNKLVFDNRKTMSIDSLTEVLCTPYECFNKIN